MKPKRVNPGSPKKPEKPRSALGRAAAARGAAAKRPVYQKPTNPEYKKLRKRWWYLLGGGLVFVTASFLIRAYTNFQYTGIASTVCLTLAYASIFYALYLDWVKMRPMREVRAQPGKSGKAAKSSETKDSAKPAETDKKAKSASK